MADLSSLFNIAGRSYDMNSLPPDIQSYLDKGYITPASSNDAGQVTFNYNDLAIPKSVTGQSFESFWKPGGISGVLKMINPKATTQDPNYGTITANTNQYQPADVMTYLTPIMEAAFGAGFGGLVNAFGGGLGGIGNTLFKGAGSEILGGGGNPLASLQNLFSRGGGSTASQVSPLLSILALLGRLGKGGTTPS